MSNHSTRLERDLEDGFVTASQSVSRLGTTPLGITVTREEVRNGVPNLLLSGTPLESVPAEAHDQFDGLPVQLQIIKRSCIETLT
jgi:hypothetical protein